MLKYLRDAKGDYLLSGVNISNDFTPSQGYRFEAALNIISGVYTCYYQVLT